MLANVGFGIHENRAECIKFCKNCKEDHFSSDRNFAVYLDEFSIDG